MKISPKWLREFVSIPADDRKLADDLTLAGIAVESIQSSASAALVYDMDITTNRVDAMNHYGVARECSAIYDVDLKPVTPKLKESAVTDFPIYIADGKLCARYTARMVRNVKIGASPEKIQKRFAELDQKPINNAADASNYALLELGHPTHAFDADRLAGGKIIVRLAKPGESLKTLDGVERKLHPEDLVIADSEKPVALAGVMGGFDSMITGSTTNILIESAWFDPTSIRRTARRHAMHTDASHRFERGADWGACPLACSRVAELIVESCGGAVSPEIDVVARAVGHAPVKLRFHEITRVLGKEISAAEVERILRRLGFGLKKDGDTWTVTIPTWRMDVEREIDLIEEVARIHGFNRFPNTLPPYAGGVVELPQARAQAKLRSRLLALGYNEALSLTFVAKEESQHFSSSAPVLIANPLSEEAGSMRTSLIPGMLAMLTNNLNRGNEDVRLFEIGHVFAMQGGNVDERPALCFAAYGHAEEPNAQLPHARDYSFYDLKGGVESLLELFEAQQLEFDTNAPEYFHPGRRARAVLNRETVARFGQLEPEIAAARKIKQPIYLAEVALDRLLQIPLRTPRYKKLSRFPAVERDFSFVFEDSVSFDQLRNSIEALRLPELRSINAKEVFRGGNVPAGKYSILVRVTFQSLDRTLREEEVAEWTAQIVTALKNIGGTQRA